MKNQMFEEMEKAALGWLKGRDPGEIAQRAGVTFDGSAFCFFSLGQQVCVTYPEYEITPKLHHWQHLIMLHYLNLADGTPLTGRPISFGQYTSGMIRGGDFDRRAELFFCTMERERLKKCCLALGGIEKCSKADLCMELPFLPRYPVTVHFWQADEDFSASGRLTVDVGAPHYLTIEDAVTVGELILEKLKEG